MQPASLARVARPVWVGALVVALMGCAIVNRHVTVWPADDPAGVYPSGPLSGEPAYFVGWRVYQ